MYINIEEKPELYLSCTFKPMVEINPSACSRDAYKLCFKVKIRRKIGYWSTADSLWPQNYMTATQHLLMRKTKARNGHHFTNVASDILNANSSWSHPKIDFAENSFAKHPTYATKLIHSSSLGVSPMCLGNETSSFLLSYVRWVFHMVWVNLILGNARQEMDIMEGQMHLHNVWYQDSNRDVKVFLEHFRFGLCYLMGVSLLWAEC